MSEDAKPTKGYADIRPLVGSSQGTRGVLMFGTVAGVAAVLLFFGLEARRATITAPAISMASAPAGASIASPPELYIPQAPSRSLPIEPPIQLSVVAPHDLNSVPDHPPQSVLKPRAQRLPRRPRASAPPPLPTYVPPPPPLPIPYNNYAPRGGVAEREDIAGQADRVRAARFANPATTVPKGTLISAVLETALDSTRPGFARAIVSHDVFSFDGSRVLIAKGSRLVGEYKSDFAPGQKRVQIQWQRLMRPDGAFVNLDSPAADPLGRAGVGGQVNTHFFERFGGAILQSILSIGGQVAASKISSGSVVVAVPLQTAASPVSSSSQVQPTLKVRQGTSVSVFVSKDLDFSAVER